MYNVMSSGAFTYGLMVFLFALPTHSGPANGKEIVLDRRADGGTSAQKIDVQIRQGAAGVCTVWTYPSNPIGDIKTFLYTNCPWALYRYHFTSDSERKKVLDDSKTVGDSKVATGSTLYVKYDEVPMPKANWDGGSFPVEVKIFGYADTVQMYVRKKDPVLTWYITQMPFVVAYGPEDSSSQINIQSNGDYLIHEVPQPDKLELDKLSPDQLDKIKKLPRDFSSYRFTYNDQYLDSNRHFSDYPQIGPQAVIGLEPVFSYQKELRSKDKHASADESNDQMNSPELLAGAPQPQENTAEESAQLPTDSEEDPFLNSGVTK